MSNLLYEGSEWDFETIEKVYDACEKIAVEELNLNLYKNQIEIISSEQMLDAYASSGLPVYYKHWSFGKHFMSEERQYKSGQRGLAYEIVINSDPCINYLMEENSITTQTLVIAHAAFGHNHFFKNNYLFKEWTDATHIIDYLLFARNYIAECEEKYGPALVEKVLDSCHAISRHGVNKYHRPDKLNTAEEAEKQSEREEYIRQQYDILWSTLPDAALKKKKEQKSSELQQPEENILYFLEKNSPILEPWQRELLRITRKISQYFYPQYQTKVMNEGWACFTHFYIMNRLFDKGLVSAGAMLEFLPMHTNVVYQPTFDNQNFSGFNPYYLGFEMFRDIKRICEEPTDEDREWFPDIAGSDWLETCLSAVENYRDESFIKQFLSPTLMRKMGLFLVNNNTSQKEHYEVTAIHNGSGYKEIRNALAKQHDIATMIPDIQVSDVDFQESRKLTLKHTMSDGKELTNELEKVAEHIKRLWGYQVEIQSRYEKPGKLRTLKYATSDTPQLTIE